MNLRTVARRFPVHLGGEQAPCHGLCSHPDTAHRISFAIVHTKYTKWRLDDSTIRPIILWRAGAGVLELPPTAGHAAPSQAQAGARPQPRAVESFFGRPLSFTRGDPYKGAACSEMTLRPTGRRVIYARPYLFCAENLWGNVHGLCTIMSTYVESRL